MRARFVLICTATLFLALPATASAGTIEPIAAQPAACSITTSAVPGSSITVDGTGFQPDGQVDVTIEWSGSNATRGGSSPTTTQQTPRTDANGTFSLQVDAGPGHGGRYTFSASDGSCTATAERVAVETAGGLAGGGTVPTLPPTDTVGTGTGTPTGSELPAALAGLGVALLVGAGALAWRRRVPR